MKLHTDSGNGLSFKEKLWYFTLSVSGFVHCNI